MLDLFSGRGSWRDAFEQMGMSVVSLDVNPRSDAEIKIDILKWRYWEDYKTGDFEVICASVPCEQYSTAHCTGKARDIPWANKITQRTFKIIRYFKPKNWFIENPRFGKLRDQPFMRGITFIDVDYCRFSEFGYKKPTRIWGPP